MLDLYVVYDHPRDYPGGYVLRKWRGEVPTRWACFADTLEGIRSCLPNDLYNLGRFDEDDPAILEVWV